MKHLTGRGSLGAGLAVVVGLSAVLATSAGATSVPDDDSSTSAASGDDVALEALYEAARDEGSLTLYTTTPDTQTVPQIDAFTTLYPGIEVEYIRLSTAELLQRFASEEAAGVNEADVLSTPDGLFIQDGIANGTLVSLQDAELPGEFPPAGLPPEFVFDDGAYASMSVSPIGITYLTSDVSAEEAPTTYEELLDPKWEGRIGSPDPASSGSAVVDFWDFIARTYGDDFLQAFKDQVAEFSLLPVPLAQAQAAGEFAITVPTFPSLTQSLVDSGAPLEMVIPEVTTGSLAYIGIAAAAPHPNSARLFTHFVYSEEGTTVYAAPVAHQANPYGNDPDHMVPSGYVFPDSATANSEERKQELLQLLGRG